MTKGNFEKRCSPARRFVFTAMVLLLAGAAVTPLLALEPVLNDVQPRGGQRGKTFTLTFKGDGLAAGADLITSLHCTITKLAPRADTEKPDSQLAYLIHVPDDAATGAYPLRIQTPGGLSNVQIFTISRF